VLLNLGSNAVKFQSEGEIDIVVVFDSVESVLNIAVHDCGVGIDPDFARDCLFTPFARGVHSSGTGLGLSICKRMMDEVKGTIRYQPRQGSSGSSFFVAVPCDSAVARENLDCKAKGEEQHKERVVSKGRKFLFFCFLL
jgi:two-component system sensor histidine kinase/response regulator